MVLFDVAIYPRKLCGCYQVILSLLTRRNIFFNSNDFYVTANLVSKLATGWGFQFCCFLLLDGSIFLDAGSVPPDTYTVGHTSHGSGSLGALLGDISSATVFLLRPLWVRVALKEAGNRREYLRRDLKPT